MAKTKKSRGSAARTKAIATTGSVNENEVALKIDSGLRVIHYAIIWVVVVGLTFIVTASRNRVDILAISDDAGTNITKVLAFMLLTYKKLMRYLSLYVMPEKSHPTCGGTSLRLTWNGPIKR